MHLRCQVAQKDFHFFGTHFLWMPNAMKTDVALNPVYVSGLSAGAIAVRAHGLADSVEQFWRTFGRRGGQFLHAAFLADLPSRGQEIDGKLQSNSS